MEYEPKYTVVLRGQEFVLTKSQIEFDSPNYFTACFLGDFQEAQTKRLELSRNPDLFKLIVEYLCGYDVLPLSDKAVPSLPASTTLSNLRADALFYQLDGLVKSCDSLNNPRQVSKSLVRSFLVIGYTAGTSILSDVDSNQISVRGLSYSIQNLRPGDNTWTTIITEEMLSQMGQLQSPESHTDFQGLQTISAIENFARKVVGDYRQHGWHLMGWRAEAIAPRGPSSVVELLVVLVAFPSRKK